MPLSTVVCLPSVLYSLACCYTGKQKLEQNTLSDGLNSSLIYSFNKVADENLGKQW